MNMLDFAGSQRGLSGRKPYTRQINIYVGLRNASGDLIFIGVTK